ncbi:MAG TPA: hypothetical protein VN963_00035, partial [bacterium]|nr:hypothetical protein [bacterium]
PPPFSNETTVLTAWNGLFDSPAPASTGIGQVASYGTTVIVADAENNQIEFYSGSSTIPFVSTNPAYSVLTSDNNPAGAVAFNNPQGVAVDPTGMLYISDTSNNRIVLMSVSGVFNTILGPLVDSSLPDPNLSGNTGIKVDNASPPNIYVADTVNNRIVVFQPSGSGSNLVPAPTVGPAP